MSLISGTLTAIENNDLQLLTRYLRTIPLIDLPAEAYNRLLGIFLNSASKLERTEAGRIIISVFEEGNVLHDRLSVATAAFITNEVEEETLFFIRRILPEKHLDEYIIELLNWDSGASTQNALGRLGRTFNDTPGNVWSYLYDVAAEYANVEGFANEVVADFLRAKREETSDFKPKPQWVKNFREVVPFDVDLIPPEPEPMIFNLPTAEEAARLLTEGMKVAGLNLELLIPEDSPDTNPQLNTMRSIQDQIITQYSVSTTEEKIALLKPVMETRNMLNVALDREIFQVLGPSNMIYNSTYSKDDICTKYGGCRMFACTHYLEDEYNDDMAIDEQSIRNPTDWFHGACDFCSSRIEQFHYAVRRPLVLGGWKGCYCSWECVANDTPSEDKVALVLIGRIMAQVNEIGIQDRRQSD